MLWTSLLAADPKTSLDATTTVVAGITAVAGIAAAWLTSRGTRGKSAGATTTTLTDIIAELHDERDEFERAARMWERRARARGYVDTDTP